MKKHILLIVVALIVGFAFAAVNDYVPIDHRAAFEVTNSSSGKMNIHFTLPDYTLENVTVGDMQFQKVHIQDAGQTVQDGLPQLPYLTITLAIPYQGAPQLSFIGAQTQVINNIRAFPVQEGIAEESPKSFVYDAEFYQTNTLYPQSPLECSEPYILRDFRLLSIQVNPFSYNAATQELTVSESMEFELDFTDQPSANEIAGEFTGYSPAFTKIYEANIFNFNDYRYYITENQPPRYLIIYGGTNHDNNFQTALNDFVLWKKQKGAEVDLAGTSVAGTSTTAIKSYIQSRYDNPVTRPDYIVLIGDTGGSYAIPCYTVDSGASDYSYTFLAGNDSVGDVMIGRISVENISQLQNIFNKIYLYERDLNISTADWLNRMLLVGDPAHNSGISCIYVSKYIKEMALKVNPNYTFTELYSGSFSTGMNQAISNGVGFFSYRGWIGMSGWSPNDSQLSNGYKLVHAVIPTCSSGNFSSTATSEAFIRLGSATAPKGAVTATGMATSRTRTLTNNALCGGTYGGIFTWGMRTMGEAVLNGKLFLHEVFGSSYYNSIMLYHASWFNLMGDPTMEVFVGIPDTFSAIVPTTIALGTRLIDVVALNGALEHVADASVTLSQGHSILSKGYTDENGAVTLPLPTVMSSTDCVLTISKHNFKPVQITITVDATGTLTPGTLTVDDDNQGQSQGNADGAANAGETIELTFGINNTKAEAINGVSGYLICDSPYVTIADSTVTFGNIPAGGMGSNSPAVVLQIANNIPNNTYIRLTMQLIDDQGNEYQVVDRLQVGNAEIMYHSYQVIDAGVNNVLDPGETGGLKVTLSNVGAQALTGVSARLYSDNDLVSVTSSNIVFYGDLLQNIEITPNSEAFGLKARDQVLPGMTIPMRMKIYNDAGFEQWVYFSFTVGSVTVHSPLGPDEYGYVIYDDGDVFYEECPIYDWIGIAPAEGGFGTALPISDTYSSSNEGDQTNANSLAVVDLPFTFQFYGESYSQITVSSNGFIVMGITENAEFRNYRIPGPMGPSPMIAPFWDDLATHTGSGIYTFFDRSNHAFIIEWYNMRNGANGSSPETFQVILYDPAVHAGSMGDGPIKIQYHTFNNVDSTTSVPGHHGRYATIGIKNAQGNIGLEYSFANTYPAAASPLGNNRALYITNIPIHYEAPHMVIGETHVTDPNNNGVCEPGETINLGVELSNIGNSVADQLRATLSTMSPYVTMVQDTAAYYPIDGESSGYNRTPFVFTVSESCPDGTVLEFNLDITAGEDAAWSRAFTLRVDASTLEYLGFLINDADAVYDGVIEPGETIKLAINVKNRSAVAATGLLATLSSPDSNHILISNPMIQKGSVDANDIVQFVYEIEFNLTDTESSYKSMQFNVSLDNGRPMSTTIMVPFNMNNIFSDFETENGGFTPGLGWSWGTPAQVTPFSGTKLWATNLSGNYPDSITWDLYTPVYALQTGSQLKFMHRYGFENNYDGGNIAISTNNGDTWTLLTPNGGYTHSSLTGLNSQPGFSGFLSMWQQVVCDLSQYANQMVMFRFRIGADETNESIGWFIDNFELSGVDQKTGYITGVVFPTSDADVTKASVRANTFYSTNPDETGHYTLYLPNGTHSITASLPYHQSSTVNGVSISPSAPTYELDFTLINLPPPAELAFTVDNDTGLVSLAWGAPFDPVHQVMGYYVYKRFNTGPFVRYQELNSQTLGFEDHIDLDMLGQYKYYVTAKYLNTEGEPSNLAEFDFPYYPPPEAEQTPALVTKLAQNYPNPFNPITTISFDLARPGQVKLNVYNIKGQLVRSLVNGALSAGSHKVVWNGTDARNRSVASGIYYYRLETKNYTKTNKMVLMK
jgi:hypothetical protein